MSINTGLSSEQAGKNRAAYGINEITRSNAVSPVKIFLSQFTSPLILVLVFAALISMVIGYLPGQEHNFVDAILIIVIVVISGISGFFQEYKAEKSIESLQKMATPEVHVLRDGEVVVIPATELTVDDVAILESGDIVPADGVIIESFGIKVDESLLTGESAAVDKHVNEEIYMDTSVRIGSAKFRVSNIGMKTKVGLIAGKLEKIEDEKTSFEVEVNTLSLKIFKVVSLITIVIFIVNYLKYNLYTSLLTAVSLAVAAIPEGLPAVVVLSLALGARTMYKRNALTRKLDVVESIGAVDIICTDKTGTITKNEMTVTKLYLDKKIIDVEIGNIDGEGQGDIEELIRCGVICNNTKTKGHPEANREYFGEQTEIGLIKIGERFNISPENTSERFVRVNEVPFSSERKMMSVVVKDIADKKNSYKVFSKGAPEILISKCKRILVNGKVRKMNDDYRETILSQNSNFASNALRVLGFAYKPTRSSDGDIEEDLIWIGLQAMIDPPHPETKKVMSDCKSAGIRVIMITGDNSTTARAIANNIGLESAEVLGGKDIDKLENKELAEKLKEGVNIFARTDPFHKLRILKILKKTDRVAMTGDGVNDSLALKQADVGIAMGQKGTSVAKESSDIVLLDDNFSTIVVAVEEGRRIFDNIRKFINYLLVSNMAEVAVLFLSIFFFKLKDPILLPAQILWINLLTDGLPALALGSDPARTNIMSEHPRKKDAPLIDKKLGWLIGIMGAKKTIVLLITFFLILPHGEELARTALFTGFVLYEFVRIAGIRSMEKLTWFSNPWLLLALLSSLILQLLIVYTPLNGFFSAVALGWYEWAILASGVFVGYLLAIMISKLVTRHFDSKEEKAVSV